MLRTSAGAHIVAAELVSGGYFTTLGVPMRFGRAISDADDRPGAPLVVVVSQALWRDIASDAGSFEPRTLTVNATEFSIVGVAARPFEGMEVGRDTGLWSPLNAQIVLDPAGGRNLVPRRTTSWLTVVAVTALRVE